MRIQQDSRRQFTFYAFNIYFVIHFIIIISFFLFVFDNYSSPNEHFYEYYIIKPLSKLGVCEVSVFQKGQRVLITASATVKQVGNDIVRKMSNLVVAPPVEVKIDPKAKKIPIPEPVIARTESIRTDISIKSPRTLLIGDSTVEWYSRILDPDGQLEGDIVGAGKVTYATRKSDVRTISLEYFFLSSCSHLCL